MAYRAASLAARGDYRYVGDPGLFGFLGNVAKKVTGIAGSVLPGPFGGVARAANRVLGGTAGRSAGVPAPPPMLNARMPGGSTTFLGARGPLGVQVGFERTTGATASAAITGGGGGCPQGYHLNKSGYYTRAGYVPPRSKCVRYRRMNVGNARALRRGLRRARGFEKLARKVIVASKRYKK